MNFRSKDGTLGGWQAAHCCMIIHELACSSIRKSQGSIVDTHKLIEEHFLFIVSMKKEISENFYQSENPKYPLQINVEFTHFGNSSSRKVYTLYEGGSICNENPFITPSTNALGFNAICQTKDQSVAVIMVHKTFFYLSKFNKLQTF